MNYETLLEQIERQRDFPNREESFQAFRRALARLDLPHLHDRVFVVAGTNGKGTVAKTLEVLLASAGERVGLYTSPHLIDTVERIRSGGSDLSHDEFVRAYELVEFACAGLSHFEILTLLMAEVFFGGRVREPVTCAVLEVGVGGRLDPVRCFPHFVSVITSLSLDHVALLGPDLASIARAKFGVVDAGGLVVHGPLTPEAREVANEVRTERGGRWIEVEAVRSSVAPGASPRWILDSAWGPVELAVKGARGAENTALALAALEAAGFDVPSLIPALPSVVWPGRMEEFFVSGRRVFLSGDHNPAGVASLSEILRAYNYRALWLVVGIGSGKARDEMLAAFTTLPRARLVLTATPFRGGALTDYGVWNSRAEFASVSPREALAWTLAAADESDLILVTGSLYLVGDLRRDLLAARSGASDDSRLSLDYCGSGPSECKPKLFT